MEYKKVLFSDVSAKEWDAWVLNVPGSCHFHSAALLDYFSKFEEVEKNASFAFIDHTGKPLAICSLASSYLKDRGVHSISFGHAPCGVPVVAPMPRQDRKKILDNIISEILAFAKENKASEVSFFWDPLNTLFMHEGGVIQPATFELLRYNLIYEVENTIAVDLEKKIEDLSADVSKYHLRHIKRGYKKGLAVRVFNRENNADQIDRIFKIFEDTHIKSAGRMTRPQATWDSMLDGMRQGKATLFVTYLKDEAISFLYCGEFDCMAFGWSQINLDEFEKEYSPRHLLEWEAILYYKQKGFKYYEIGERYFTPQLYHVPSAKELSISVFKERYGGMFLPKIKWMGYLDNGAMRAELKQKTGQFVDNALLFSMPEQI
ncbi:MAG: GNAT family N-acetyltransferase [Patescibacteria group bacterium]